MPPLRTVSLHAFRTIMPLCHFLKQLYFQPNGKQSGTFFGLWASNEAYYGAIHTMWRCPTLRSSWFSTTILEIITVLPLQTVWCVYTDWWGFFFLSSYKKKSLCGYYCAVQIISLLFALRCLPGAARLITICYDPRNCKRVHKTPVLISAQPEITKLKQVFHKHRMWIFNST